MRYMMLVRSVAPAGLPPSAFLEAMGKLSAQGRESGMLIAGGQLGGADASARVHLAAGKIGVSDGPFPEAKEVIGGYAILEYADKQAALEGCAGFLELHRQHWPGGKAKSKCAPSSTKTSAPAAPKSSARRTVRRGGPSSDDARSRYWQLRRRTEFKIGEYASGIGTLCL